MIGWAIRFGNKTNDKNKQYNKKLSVCDTNWLRFIYCFVLTPEIKNLQMFINSSIIQLAFNFRLNWKQS